MALEGTLRDFSLADIFQLIAIQRKTGVLTLKSEADVVTVAFLNGNVVSADSMGKALEDRLGTVLVKSGSLSEERLSNALQTQKNTLQRLGTVLVKERFISKDVLRHALQLQVTQIIYRLFRWRDGDYHFSQERNLDYDRENFTPISAQSILMEGVRMLDEWPIIEKRIRSLQMVFEKVDADLAIHTVEDVGSLDPDLDIQFGDAEAPAPAEEKSNGNGNGMKFLPQEALVYGHINGRATIQELVDRSHLGEFDTCRTVYDLLDRKVIREVQEAPAADAAERGAGAPVARGALVPLGYMALIAIAVISLVTMSQNPLNLVPLPMDESPTVDSFKRLLSKNRVDRIDRGLYLYFLEHQSFATSLPALVDEAFLPSQAIVDPWGRPYEYQILPEGYRIVGFDNGGVPDPTLTLTRRFPSGVFPDG